MRRRFRLLFAALMSTGVIWLYISNYVNLGISPLAYIAGKPKANLTIWVGALLMGLILDTLVGIYLRHLFASVRTQERGRPVPAEEVRRAAQLAIDFPQRAALTLIGVSMGLSLVHKAILYGQRLPALLANPVTRMNLMGSFLREFLLILVLALLLYTFSRRLLRVAISGLGLVELPAGGRTPIGGRILMLILVQTIFYSAFVALNPDIEGARLALGLATPALLCGGVAFLVTRELSGDLGAISARLRGLAAGVRPDLFQRFSVTDRDDVGEVVAAINVMQDRVEQEFRRIQLDLAAARSVQTQMLQTQWTPPPGWDVAVRLLPAEQVGGDFYDMIDLGAGRFAVAVGDATGKGLSAALLMASTVSLLRSQAALHHSPGDLLAAVNRLLHGSVPQGFFVTVACAVVDTERSSVTLASAGHWPPVVGGQEADALPGLPLGIDPEVRYREFTYPLKPGEPLFFFSDGLVEQGPALQQEGVLLELVHRHDLTAAARLDLIFGRGDIETGGRAPDDDVMGVLLIPPAIRRMRLPSRHGAELTAARETAAFLQGCGWGDRAEAAATSVGEACLNAILHGNGLREELEVEVCIVAGPAAVEITVTDRGEVFAFPTVSPNLRSQMEGESPIGGWGLHLIQSLTDEVRVEPLQTGKLVRMRILAGGAASV